MRSRHTTAPASVLSLRGSLVAKAGRGSAECLMMRAFGVLAVSLALAAPLVGQSLAEVEAEPIVKLRRGETAVPGQCLTEQELELIAALNALRRPTVGVEGEGQGDDAAPFDPHYLVGTWRIEGVLPESVLGDGGEFLGTETVRYAGGCTYESTLEATLAESTVTVSARLIYDRRSRYLVRIEDDSRGFQLVKVGAVGGDPGGYFSHHWQAPAISVDGRMVRLTGRTFMSSPIAFRLRMQISEAEGRFVNFGTLWWRRAETDITSGSTL